MIDENTGEIIAVDEVNTGVYDESKFDHRMPPYLTTPEDRERFNELRTWEKYILEHRAEELNDRYAQIFGIWHVYQNRLYKVLSQAEWGDHQTGENSLEEENETFNGFLRGLHALGGVEVAEYSTWNEIKLVILRGLHQGMTLERSIRLSCTGRGAVKKLDNHGVTQTIPTNGQFERSAVTVERGPNADKVLGKSTIREMYETLADTQSSKDAMKIVNHDLGVTSTEVTNLQRVKNLSEIPSDSTWSYYWGEVMIKSPQGDTPYQFCMLLDSDMTEGARVQVLSKLTRRYSHVGRM